MLIFGNSAEKTRGDWMTLYGGHALGGVDEGHMAALQFINTNIMEPADHIAMKWGIHMP